MAYVGLSNPYIAKLVNEAAKIYTGCFSCGEAVSVNITPNYNEAKLFSNNRLSDMAKEFKDGSISLGTDRLPIQALKTCFGHEVDDAGKKVTYRTGDYGDFVGVGFYVDERIAGKTKYVATILYKVRFSEAANEYATKGESLEFKTPTIEGTIAGLETGEWKTTNIFDTKTEADAWLRETLGYKEENPPEGTEENPPQGTEENPPEGTEENPPEETE